MARPTLSNRVVRGLLPGALAGLPLVTAGAVYTSDSVTAPLDVTLQILANCVVSANPLDFGSSQGVLASAVSSSTTISVTCSNTTPYTLGLSAGSGAGSTTSSRYMSGAGASPATVKFDLFQSSGGANWGNTPGTDTLAGTGTGSTQTLTVYGRVPQQATPMPDRYVSTVTATVYF